MDPFKSQWNQLMGGAEEPQEPSVQSPAGGEYRQHPAAYRPQTNNARTANNLQASIYGQDSTQPRRSPWEEATDIDKQGKAAGDWLGSWWGSDKPWFEKGADLLGKGLEGLNLYDKEVAPKIWAKIGELEEDPTLRQLSKDDPKAYWDKVAADRFKIPFTDIEIPGFKGAAELAVNPLSYAGGIGVAAKGLGLIGKTGQALTTGEKVLKYGSKVPLAASTFKKQMDYSVDTSPEVMAFVTSQLENDPEKRKLAQEDPRAYWNEVAKQLPGEGFLLKGLAEEAVNPYNLFGFGVAKKVLPGALGKIAGPLEQQVSRVMGAPIEIPLKVAGKALKATWLGKLSKPSELRVFETEAQDSIAKWQDAGKTFDDVRAVANGDVTPLADLDEGTSAFIKGNAADITKVANNADADIVRLNNLKSKWVRMVPDQADKDLIINARSQPAMDDVLTRFKGRVISSDEAKNVRKMFDDHGDLLTNPNDISGSLIKLRRAKQEELGIKGQGPVSKVFSNANALVKEAWLPLNVAFHLANFTDNMAKAGITGVRPRGGKAIDALALEQGMPIPSDVTGGYTSAMKGERKGPLSSLPVLGGAIQKGWGTAQWIEKFWRYSAWWKEAQKYLGERSPLFFDTLSREMQANGVAPEIANGIATALRQRGSYRADAIVEVFRQFENTAPTMPLSVVGPNNATGSEALQALTNKLGTLNQLAPDVQATAARLIAEAEAAIRQEARNIKLLPEDAKAWRDLQTTKWKKIFDAIESADNPEQAYLVWNATIEAKRMVDALSAEAASKIKAAKDTPIASWQAVWDSRNQKAMDALNAIEKIVDEMPTPRIGAGEYLSGTYSRQATKKEVAVARDILDRYTAEANQQIYGPGGIMAQIEKAKALYKKRTKQEMKSWNPTLRVKQLEAKMSAIYEHAHKKGRQAMHIASGKIRKALETDLMADFPTEYKVVFKNEELKGELRGRYGEAETGVTGFSPMEEGRVGMRYKEEAGPEAGRMGLGVEDVSKPATEAAAPTSSAVDTKQYSPEIQQALRDWRENRAYIDNNGNYHLKTNNTTGPIAPWNKEAKVTFKSVDDLYVAAHKPVSPSISTPTLTTPEPIKANGEMVEQGKEPWEMTKEEFGQEFWLHGRGNTHPKFGQEITWGGITKDPDEARSFARVNTKGEYTTGEIALIRRQDIPEDFLEDIGTKTSYSPIRSVSWKVDRSIPGDIKDPHRYLVEQALSEGRPAPDAVLQDYPDLAAKAQPSPATAPVAPEQAVGATIPTQAIPTEAAGETSLVPTEQSTPPREWPDYRSPRLLPEPELRPAELPQEWQPREEGTPLLGEGASPPTTPPTAAGAGATPPAPRSIDLPNMPEEFRQMLAQTRQERQALFQQADAIEAQNLRLLAEWQQKIDAALAQGLPRVQQTQTQIAAIRAARARAIQMARQMTADASAYGNRKQKETFFDYAARTNLDELLQKVSPFTIWQTRNMPWYLTQMLQKPVLGKTYMAYQRESEEQRKDANLTGRFKRQVALGPLDKAAEWATGRPGAAMWGDPLSAIMSIGQQMKEPYEPEGVTDAGKAINIARTALGGLSLYPWIGLPLQAAGVFGDQPYSDILPQSRLVRAATGALGNRLDPEGFWKEGMTKLQGQPTVGTSTIEDYYISKRLAEMVEAKEITQAQAMRAMDNPKDRLWVEAQKAVQAESDRMGAMRYFLPMNVKALTPEEKEIRAGRAQMPEYSENMSEADKKQRSQVYDAYPGISAMNAIDNSPEKRELLALQNDYYGLGTPAQQAAMEKANSVTYAERAKALTPAEQQLVYDLQEARRRWLATQPVYADYVRYEAETQGRGTIDEYLSAKKLPTERRESILAAQTQPQGITQQPARQGQQVSYQIPTSGEGAEFYRQQQTLLGALEAYYNVGDERVQTLQDTYMGIPKGAARTAWIRSNPQEFQTLQAFWDQRDQMKQSDPMLAAYLAWSSANQNLPEGTSKTDAFLRQYQGGSMATARQSSGSLTAGYTPSAPARTPATGVPTSAYATPRTSYAPRSNGGGYAPRQPAQSPWQTFEKDAGPQLLGELQTYWQQKTPISTEGTAFLQSLFAKYPMGAKDFADWLNRVLRGAWLAKGTRSSMPLWMLKSLGYQR